MNPVLNPVEIFEKIISFVKESTKTFFIIGGTCAAIIFFSKELGTESLSISIKPYLVIILIICVLGMVANLIQAIKNIVAPMYFNYRYRHRLMKISKSLTPEEKMILKKYIDDKTKVQSLDSNYGVISDLCRHGFIIESTNYMDGHGSWCQYNLTDFAYEYLIENPNLLSDD